jgi:hypothetical protein
MRRDAAAVAAVRPDGGGGDTHGDGGWRRGDAYEFEVGQEGERIARVSVASYRRVNVI